MRASFVDQLNRMARDHFAKPRFDINLYTTREPNVLLFVTREELDKAAANKYHQDTPPCKSCQLRVALFGYGCYWLDDDEDGGKTWLRPHDVCKACWVYDRLNDLFEATSIAPAVSPVC